MAQADVAAEYAAKVLSIDCDAVAEIFAELTLEASVAVMTVYATDPNARRKADKSFVCDADERAEAIILAGLAARLPQFPVIAEEAASRGSGWPATTPMPATSSRANPCHLCRRAGRSASAPIRRTG